MPRRKSVGMIRDIGVDSRFHSPVVQKLINMIMERGKKDISRTIVYEAFDLLKLKAGNDDTKAFQMFEKALNLEPNNSGILNRSNLLRQIKEERRLGEWF